MTFLAQEETKTWKRSRSRLFFFFWKLAYFSMNKRCLKKKKVFNRSSAALRSYREDNTIPALPSECCLRWSVSTNRPAHLKPSDAVISPTSSTKKQIPPFKRHTCSEDYYNNTLQPSSKTVTGNMKRFHLGGFMLSMKWGHAALHWWNKVTGKEKVNC